MYVAHGRGWVQEEDIGRARKRVSFLIRIHMKKEGTLFESCAHVISNTCSRSHIHRQSARHTYITRIQFTHTHATVAVILSGSLSAAMPPWNAFAMRHENCTLRGRSSLFRKREFPGGSIFQDEFRRTSFPNYSRARSSRRFHFAGIAKKFIYRKTHTKAELGSKRNHIELTFTGARATSLLD